MVFMKRRLEIVSHEDSRKACLNKESQSQQAAGQVATTDSAVVVQDTESVESLSSAAAELCRAFTHHGASQRIAIVSLGEILGRAFSGQGLTDFLQAVQRGAAEHLNTPSIMHNVVPDHVSSCREAAETQAASLSLVRCTRSKRPLADDLSGLVAELQANGILKDNGKLNKTYFRHVLQLLMDGTIAPGEQWAQVWTAMAIPVDAQASAIRLLLTKSWKTDKVANAPTLLADVVAQLVRLHKIKLNSLEAALALEGALHGFASAETQSSVSQLLTSLFPRPATCSWGWSRIGWSWKAWCAFVTKVLEPVKGKPALVIVGRALTLMQELDGKPICQQEVWVKDRCDWVVGKLSELTGMTDGKVRTKLKKLGADLATG